MTTNPKKTFILKVESRHFEGAKQADPNNCGVACALKEIGIVIPVETTYTNVDIKTFPKQYPDGRYLRLADYSKEIVKAVSDWDYDAKAIPPPFTLELPISLLEEANLASVTNT